MSRGGKTQKSGTSGASPALEEQIVDHAKTEFVALASHQLRTPIATISWLSEMLMHGDAGALSSEQEKYVRQIYASNQRLAAMVDAMLLASTLEVDHVTVVPSTVDLPATAHRILNEQLQGQAVHKTLHITEHYQPDLPLIHLDPYLVATMLHNLFSNAIKYTPRDGTVTVAIKKVATRLHAGSTGSISIEVADSGYGIPTAQKSKIFRKLYRASNIMAKDTDGTGLGLYIVKRILEQIGGRIAVVSEENRGSTFTILLPLEGMRRTAIAKHEVEAARV